MTNDELNKYIYHYLTEDKTHSAIMLTAAWGTGKSFYIQNELKPFLEKEENGKHQCVIVSLYGLDDTAEISKSIYLELRTGKITEWWNEKVLSHFPQKTQSISKEAVGLGKSVGKTIFKGLTGKIGIDFDISDNDLKKLYASIDLSGKLIILEDLERSGIDILEVLGYVNSLVEQDGVKVLLVANEGEIIQTEKKSIRDKDGKETEISVNTAKTEQYLRTKEKTVSDTIIFYTGFEVPLTTIIQSFGCKYFNIMLDKNDDNGKTELVETIIEIMADIKSFNLRSVIFGCQKTCDLFQFVDDSFDIDFLERMLCANIAFSLRLKESDSIQWTKKDEKSSAALGTYKFPLLKVAFDYIKFQYCDKNELKKANETYLRQKETSQTQSEIREHINVLYSYYLFSEAEVLTALKNVLHDLENENTISCGEYGELANYLVAIHTILGNDDDICRCRNAMINNVKENCSVSLEDDLRFHSGISLESENGRNELSEWINDLISACKIHQKAPFIFDYLPDGIDEFGEYVSDHKGDFIEYHAFASKFDDERLIDLISKLNASQIFKLRRAFRSVYSFSNLADFFADDKETLEKIKDGIDNIIESNKAGDKIIQLQLQCFSDNIRDYIARL